MPIILRRKALLKTRARFTAWSTGVCAAALMMSVGCASDRPGARNALAQQTGEEGSTMPRSNPPFYPNTAGNIVAPPGNPGGNAAGAPPIVGGNMNQEGGWPYGR